MCCIKLFSDIGFILFWSANPLEVTTRLLSITVMPGSLTARQWETATCGEYICMPITGCATFYLMCNYFLAVCSVYLIWVASTTAIPATSPAPSLPMANSNQSKRCIGDFRVFCIPLNLSRMLSFVCFCLFVYWQTSGAC